jgi:peptidyl-prolyl cis-trans isomerase SurA
MELSRVSAPSLAIYTLVIFMLAAGGSGAQEPADKPVTAPAAPATPPAELAASHILIQYSGAARAAASVTRTKEEAASLADEIAKKAQAGEDFAELAKKYSDGPSAPRGGNLGTFAPGRMVPAFSEACMKLEEGGVSGPVETEFGYHVIHRNKIEKVAARHVLVMHNDSPRKPPSVNRTREEAMEICAEVLAKARAGEDFQALAREYSDGPSASRGGDLRSFGRGAMVPAFDEAVFALEVGGISDVVETRFGCHVIQRYE